MRRLAKHEGYGNVLFEEGPVPPITASQVLIKTFGPLSVRAADLIAAGRMRVDPMITHRFPAEQAPEAFALLDQHPDQAFAVLLEWPQ